MTDNPLGTPGSPDQSLATLLDATRDPEWDVRRDALRELGPRASESPVRARVVEMLDDADSAVIAEAAEALVVHGGARGLDAVLIVLDSGPDDAGYAVSDRLLGVVHDHPVVAARLRERASADDAVGQTATELLKELGIG